MTADPALLPDWDIFERDYVADGVPHTFLVIGDPEAHLFVDTGGSRLGARFRLPAAAPAAAAVPMLEIRSADVSIEGRRYLEVSTASRTLFPNFYRLLADVVTAVAAGAGPSAALAEAVARWDDLLQRPIILSDEAQAGLFGELWFLHRLLRIDPVDAVAAWTGPAAQAHDFRRGNDEFEVKTTVGENRIHTINGLGQLTPSPDASLFLVSLQITAAGAGGLTLPESVEAVRELVPEADRAAFARRLDVLGYRTLDAALYPLRRKLRSPAMLAPISGGFPRLTDDALAALPPEFDAGRIRRVTYSIDVTGLGDLDGSPAFHAVLPPAEGDFQ